MQKKTYFFNYCATHLESKIRYKKIDMKLYIYSDEFYSSYPGENIRAGGFFYLGPNLKPRKIHHKIYQNQTDHCTWNTESWKTY